MASPKRIRVPKLLKRGFQTPRILKRRLDASIERRVRRLPLSEQKILSESGFKPTLEFVRPGSERASELNVQNFPETTAFAIRKRESGALANPPRLGFVARTKSSKDKFPTRASVPIFRHEVLHHVLEPRGLTHAQEHNIIETRLKQPEGAPKGVRNVTPKPSPTPKVVSPGFQTKQLKTVSKTGSKEQRQRSRLMMRKLGQRVRSKGIDF